MERLLDRGSFDAASFARPVTEVAPDLLGAVMSLGAVSGVVVEVEAYRQDDPASHSFRGPTPRTEVMFGPPGRWYVYRSYGIHWCVNLVCEPEGTGAAVLIRALQPSSGVARMRRRRGVVDERTLCSGPGRLTQALGIDLRVNGTSAIDGPLRLHPGPADGEIATGPRIGISKAIDVPWRFGIKGSRWLSRPFHTGAAA